MFTPAREVVLSTRLDRWILGEANLTALLPGLSPAVQPLSDISHDPTYRSFLSFPWYQLGLINV